MVSENAPMKSATYTEIITQTNAWREAVEVVNLAAQELRRLWSAGSGFDDVLFTGCGSTYYLSLAASSLWQTMIPTPSRAHPAGELYLNPKTAYGPTRNRRTLMIAVSRSGTTSETVAAVEQFRAHRSGRVIAITNYPDTPLGKLADVTIGIRSGQEESVAQTRSFASMYVASTAITTLLAGQDSLLASMNRLPEVGDQIIDKYEKFAQNLGTNLDLDRFYFLGSGPRYGLACEANLKMKEMTLTHSEPFHFFEFRHGPMSMVNEHAAVIGLISENNRGQESQVLSEMAELGGHVVSLGEAEADIEFVSAVPEPIRNVLYLPTLQLSAYYRSISKGLNPDRPENLTAVVDLNLND